MNLSLSLKQVWDSLEISKWTAIKTLLFGGWSDLGILLCNAFTKLLKKADQDKLLAYADFASKIAKCIRFVVDLFVKDTDIKAASFSTCDALIGFSDHVKDGEYTKDELDIDIDNINACVEDWKKTAKEKDKADKKSEK